MNPGNLQVCKVPIPAGDRSLRDKMLHFSLPVDPLGRCFFSGGEDDGFSSQVGEGRAPHFLPKGQDLPSLSLFTIMFLAHRSLIAV